MFSVSVISYSRAPKVLWIPVLGILGPFSVFYDFIYSMKLLVRSEGFFLIIYFLMDCVLKT